jgi:hypothetical protein
MYKSTEAVVPKNSLLMPQIAISGASHDRIRNCSA